MNTQNLPSFINAAITDSQNKQTSYAKVSALVEERNEEHFCNRIGGAWASLIADRNQLRILDLEANTTLVKDMAIKPEMFLSFCQYLMNQSCWAARRYIQAQQANADQEKLHGITGIDFSQDVAEDLGIEPMDISAISATIEEDFMAMLKLYSVMSTQMNYLSDIEDLHVFADRAQEGEVWKVLATADEFDDALVIMTDVLTRMNERADAELTKNMTTMDFTDAA